MTRQVVPGEQSENRVASRRVRALTLAVEAWARRAVRLVPPLVEPLEARQLLSSYPNIIVGAPSSTGSSTIDLYTYNPNTVNPTNPVATGFPLPVLSQPVTDGPVRGIAYDSNGKIQMYNGTNTPILTTYDPKATKNPFTNHDGPTGWGTDPTLPASGGLAFAPEVFSGNGMTYGPFLFATSKLNASTPNDTRGLIRFDLANGYTTFERETDAENGDLTVATKSGQQMLPLGVDFTNVSVGLNTAVYALATPNSFDNLVLGAPFAANDVQNWAVYEFDQADPLTPNTFSNLDADSTTATEVFDQSLVTPGDTPNAVPFHVDLIDPRTNEPIQDVTAVTADANGDLYVGTSGSGLFVLTDDGKTLLDASYVKSLPGQGSNPGYDATDLQFDAAGDLLATSGRNVTVFSVSPTGTNLTAVKSFNLPNSAAATFATWASASITPTPTPTPTGPTPTPTPIPLPTPTPFPPIPAPGTDLTPAVPTLIAGNTSIGQLPVYDFQVAYTDSYAIKATSPSFSSTNVTVTAPDGTNVSVQLTGVLQSGVKEAIATYQIPAPTEVGAYTVTLQGDQVEDLASNFTPGATLGTFTVGEAQTQVATGPAPKLVAQIVNKVPGAVVAGAKGSIKLKIANDGTAPINSPVQISLFASPDSSLDANAILIGQPYVVNLKLALRKSKIEKLRFNYPQFASAGAYYLLADVNSNKSILETNYASDVAIGRSTVDISPPFVDLGAGFPPHKVATFNIGQSPVESVIVTNYGNVAATGPLTIDISATSGSPTATSTGTLIPFSHAINLAPDRSQTFKIRIPPLSGLSAGTYNFVADVDPGNTFNESALTNNIATDPQSFTIL